MKLNKKIENLKKETDISIPYLNGEGVSDTLLIPDSRMVIINALKVAYDLSYELYADPATHNEARIIDMQEKYDVLFPMMEGLKKQLKYHLDVHLTGDDYTKINIHKDAERRKKVPAPIFPPNNQVVKYSPTLVRIFTSNPVSPHENEKKRPEDVSKIGRKLAITAIGDSAPTLDKYVTLDIIGTVMYNVKFNAADKGKAGWLITWYISPTGESGPPSDPLKFPII